jgi:murein DD-endopeptidase MepM/ murein hydrolase activator NlpD
MARVKYYYNAAKLKYEKVEITWRQLILRVFGFISATAVFAGIIIAIAYTYLDSPKEKQLKREINQLQLQYELMNEKLNLVENALGDLQNRDDNIYRVVFEAEPIPEATRTAGFSSKQYRELQNYSNSQLMIETRKRIDRLSRQMYIQSKSYDEVTAMVKDKSALLAAIPAIQPVANKDLTRIGSGFGYRIDPIYKTIKFHEGIDFTAPNRSEIYATGDGRVSEIMRMDRGYGNCVVIDHGYGYKTLYAHMSRFNVRPGQKVSRGEVIGYVGNTGKSTAPHLHYEVIKDGRKVNPVNFFYNDITPEQYELLIQNASLVNQAFD